MSNLISVIIPVYKVEPYLRSCIDSVLASTHRDLEVILVDDGSPDNCGAICDEYAVKDNRIIVIHQTNQGLPAARNAGLAKATGDYIGFVDSDDIISPVMYEKLLWAMRVTNADMAACEYTRTRDELDPVCTITKNELFEFNGVSDCLSVLTMAPFTRAYTWTFCTVWNKLYRKDKMIEFIAELDSSEDLFFNYQYALNIEKLVVVHRMLYYYRNNPSSLMNSPSLDKSVTTVRVRNHLSDHSHDLDPSLRRYLVGMSAYCAHNIAWKIVRAGKEDAHTDFLEQARARVKRDFKDLMAFEDLEMKVRIPAILYRYCYPLWKLSAKLHRK